MDIATLIGLVSGLGIIVVAIMLGGDLSVFVNAPSLLIVFGGTLAATFIRFPLSQVMVAFKIGIGTAFGGKVEKPDTLVKQAVDLATKVRDGGLIALEKVKIANPLLARGMSLCVDGYNLDVVRDTIAKEVDLTVQRQQEGEKIFRGIGDSAPAFGMLGTLVGLVQMLSNMDDPKTIGPAMAVAMLTTFYGALIANLIAIPIADKLGSKTETDRVLNALIVESVIQIHGNQNPRVLEEMLTVYLDGDNGNGKGGGGKGGDKKKKAKG